MNTRANSGVRIGASAARHTDWRQAPERAVGRRLWLRFNPPSAARCAMYWDYPSPSRFPRPGAARPCGVPCAATGPSSFRGARVRCVPMEYSRTRIRAFAPAALGGLRGTARCRAERRRAPPARTSAAPSSPRAARGRRAREPLCECACDCEVSRDRQLLQRRVSWSPDRER